ncbi:Putative peroxiredoxin bcp [uncultured bacterium]|nr:Putative peroxiredoxin bcp [uncultured bacterium]
MVQEGKKAPAFSLPDQNGNIVSLKKFAGKNVVLYFYPKDNTSGCTKEACSFRDSIGEIEALNAVVIGVSPDSTASHAKFAGKFELPFILLSDTEKTMLQDYGVWQEKSMYGKKYFGVVRTTVIIDPQGKVKKIFPKVKVEGHTDEVIAALKA